MGLFSKPHKPAEIPADAAAKYANASTTELKERAQVLRTERDNPTLSSDEKRKSFISAAFVSPESIVGNVAGIFLGSAINSQTKLSVAKALINDIVCSIGVGAVFGLNAFRRYNNKKRAEISEKKQAELSFVERVMADRAASIAESTPGQTK